MPKAPRGKRVVDPDTGEFVVVGKAPKGQAEPFYDRTRQVWVAPWRKRNGKLGKPTGRTRALAIESRDRHIAKAQEDAEHGTPTGGFNRGTTVAELCDWWLDNIARHRVRKGSLNTYRKQLSRVGLELGDVPVRELRVDQVAEFISELLDTGSASTAVHVRQRLAQVLDEGANLGLVKENVARKVRAPKVPRVRRRILGPSEVRGLLAACDGRHVAAVALCFVHGWRISEALGLAWQDLDLEAGTARVRRASTYVDGEGMQLGPTKSDRSAGLQYLGPTVVELLHHRHELWDADREILGYWPVVEHDGEQLDLVFTTALGKATLRQHVDKALRQAAEEAGLSSDEMGTHTGRRSVITTLYTSNVMELSDVAGFVGHADVATTRGYVQSEGDRPRVVSERAIELLDPPN